MIELKNVTKQYDHPVIKDVNLTLYPGNIYVVRGPSGSGKSTLLHLLGGLDQEYTGEIFEDHTSLKEMSQKQFQAYKNKIGYVFQESLLIPQFTVMENLYMFCEDKQSIQSMAEQFQITHILDQKPEKLSNGERQRISIIRTLLLQPSILLMDEPTAALDQKNAHVLQKQIAECKRKDQILVISTHDVLFDEIADVILNVEFGVIREVKGASVKTSLHDETIALNNKQHTRNMDIQYCFKKYQTSTKRIGFLLATSLLFLLMFLSLAVKLNFQKAYETKLERDYPYEVFSINKSLGEERLVKRDGLKLTYFNNYQKEFDTFAAISYFPKEYSSFTIPNALSYGTFPETDLEIIVNNTFIKQNLNDQKVEDAVGSEVTIENQQYRIAGILTNDIGVQRDVFISNCYYDGLFNPETELPLVFMSETAISSFVEPKDDLTVMARLTDEKLTKERYQQIYDQSASFYFYKVMNGKMYTVNLMFSILQFCFLLFGSITFIFLYYVIQLDLFHRKRELGYLQILHFSKQRVKNIIRLDYIMKIVPSLVVATILYMIGIFVIQKYVALPAL